MVAQEIVDVNSFCWSFFIKLVFSEDCSDEDYDEGHKIKVENLVHELTDSVEEDRPEHPDQVQEIALLVFTLALLFILEVFTELFHQDEVSVDIVQVFGGLDLCLLNFLFDVKVLH